MRKKAALDAYITESNNRLTKTRWGQSLHSSIEESRTALGLRKSDSAKALTRQSIQSLVREKRVSHRAALQLALGQSIQLVSPDMTEILSLDAVGRMRPIKNPRTKTSELEKRTTFTLAAYHDHQSQNRYPINHIEGNVVLLRQLNWTIIAFHLPKDHAPPQENQTRGNLSPTFRLGEGEKVQILHQYGVRSRERQFLNVSKAMGSKRVTHWIIMRPEKAKRVETKEKVCKKSKKDPLLSQRETQQIKLKAATSMLQLHESDLPGRMEKSTDTLVDIARRTLRENAASIICRFARAVLERRIRTHMTDTFKRRLRSQTDAPLEQDRSEEVIESEAISRLFATRDSTKLFLSVAKPEIFGDLVPEKGPIRWRMSAAPTRYEARPLRRQVSECSMSSETLSRSSSLQSLNCSRMDSVRPYSAAYFRNGKLERQQESKRKQRSVITNRPDTAPYRNNRWRR